MKMNKSILVTKLIESTNNLSKQKSYLSKIERSIYGRRKKQDNFWKTIFIPIHIDDFLFTIEKDTIRPKENREEYWKNIEDIREINSVDFIQYNKTDYDQNKSETQIEKLISTIKKRK